jgi:OmpA-OmpF porin, OOP family
MTSKTRMLSLLVAVVSVAALIGCASYEINTGRGNIPGMYIRSEMQEADRALDAAKQAGKDKTCPAEFKAAEDARNKAYDVFRSCRTEEGAAMAKKATDQANALCPKKEPEKVAPAPVPVPAPAPTPPADTDGDGVIDTLDKCPGTPKGVAVDNNGCPLDTDKDGVYDYLDKCPGTPIGTTVDIYGCPGAVAPAPKPAPAPVPAKKCDPIVLGVKFDTDKAVIKPVYHNELKKVGDFLKENPKAKGTIEGHTDSIGGKSYNEKLSQRRADSVRSYIIKNFGIDAGRIAAKGYGLTKPIADNKTKAGRAQNRRIESTFNCE